MLTSNALLFLLAQGLNATQVGYFPSKAPSKLTGYATTRKLLYVHDMILQSKGNKADHHSLPLVLLLQGLNVAKVGHFPPNPLLKVHGHSATRVRTYVLNTIHRKLVKVC